MSDILLAPITQPLSLANHYVIEGPPGSRIMCDAAGDLTGGAFPRYLGADGEWKPIVDPITGEPMGGDEGFVADLKFPPSGKLAVELVGVNAAAYIAYHTIEDGRTQKQSVIPEVVEEE